MFSQVSTFTESPVVISIKDQEVIELKTTIRSTTEQHYALLRIKNVFKRIGNTIHQIGKDDILTFSDPEINIGIEFIIKTKHIQINVLAADNWLGEIRRIKSKLRK